MDGTGRLLGRRVWLLAFAGVLLVPAAPAAAQPADSQEKVFDCTEGTQEWTVPAGAAEATFIVDGAAGGNGAEVIGAPSGGLGGYGYGHGGDGGGDGGGAGGGGGSAVLTAGGEPLLVAGGGGGAGTAVAGGAGGGEVGGNGEDAGTFPGGGGGTQTGPGAGGDGGDPSADGSSGSGHNGGAGATEFGDGGGGGGGWYGGGGGAASLVGAGGGGGSGYLHPDLQQRRTLESGVREGDGQVRISYRVAAEVTVAAAPQRAAPGEPVELTATVEGHPPGSEEPTGEVEFFTGDESLGGADLQDGQATISVDRLPEGTHQITAQYAGDTSYAAAGSEPVRVTVGKFDATVTVTADPAEPQTAEQVTLTAEVEGESAAGAEPTGVVEFFDGDTSLGTAVLGSPARLRVDSLSAGEHRITAEYAGDDVFNPASSEPLAVTVTVPAVEQPEDEPEQGVVVEVSEPGADEEVAELADAGAPALGWVVGLALAAFGTGGIMLLAGARLRRRNGLSLNT